jgi:hypothetical protein
LIAVPSCSCKGTNGCSCCNVSAAVVAVKVPFAEYQCKKRE